MVVAGAIDPEIAALFAELLAAIDPAWNLRGIETLRGGVSAETTALDVETPEGARRLVVRRHGPRDLANNPAIAAQEFRLLGLLAAEGIAVPAPIHLERAIFPTPALVIAFVAGEPANEAAEPAALVDAMADYLVRLHRIDATRADFAFMPRIERFVDARLGHPPAEPADGLSETRIRAALSPALPLPARNAPVLLHGDFWPGNLLWRNDADGGRIVAAIDWEDSAIGDPLAELGNARFELAWTFGAEWADRLTVHYLARASPAPDTHDLPFWDLFAALGPAGWLGDWGYDAETERAMRERHRDFVARALMELAGG